MAYAVLLSRDNNRRCHTKFITFLGQITLGVTTNHIGDFAHHIGNFSINFAGRFTEHVLHNAQN